jgi:hypothetical protein
MKNRERIVLTIVFFSVLAGTPIALCTTQSIIHVAGDGTGNYNCNGTNDQVEINQALDYAAKHPGSTVYLKGPFIYDIQCSCLIGSNTELTGDSSAKLRLVDNVGWTTASLGTPIIGQIGGQGTVVHDIKYTGLMLMGTKVIN